MRHETMAAWLLALALAATPPIAAADAVTDWDKIACDIVGASKAPTPLGVRTIAITQTAVYEAVNRITRRSPEPAAISRPALRSRRPSPRPTARR